MSNYKNDYGNKTMKLEEKLRQYISVKQRIMPKIVNTKLFQNNEKLKHRIDYFRIKEYIDNFLNGNYHLTQKNTTTSLGGR